MIFQYQFCQGSSSIIFFIVSTMALSSLDIFIIQIYILFDLQSSELLISITIDKEMHSKLWIIFALFAVRSATAFFFNLGSFLQPIYNPGFDLSGRATFSYNGNLRGTQREQTMCFGRDGSVSQSTQQPSQQNDARRSQKINQNLDATATDLYKAMGIPEDVIYNKILPIHMAVKRDLNKYFQRFSISSFGLYQTLKSLKELIHWIEQTYLKNLNSVVVGNNNSVTGEQIYAKGDNLKVEGNSSFVFGSDYSSKEVVGNNIVRIGKFDIDLDLVEQSKFNPFKCVKILQEKVQNQNILNPLSPMNPLSQLASLFRF